MDRNRPVVGSLITLGGSLSARRAWIEIDYVNDAINGCNPSLSARRAWIEINSLDDILAGVNVALRKESVDRNANRLKTPCVRLCRSPQGERG